MAFKTETREKRRLHGVLPSGMGVEQHGFLAFL